MAANERVLVTGAGGFIGHALVNRLKAEGCFVRGVDIKYPEYESTKADEFEILDLVSIRFTTWPPIWAASVISLLFTPTSPATTS